LVTLLFACAYFGVRQAIDLDSLRRGVDACVTSGAITRQEADWATLALLQTASRVASAPGHLAQPLGLASDASAKRVIEYRRRDVVDGFRQDLATIAPYGTAKWRSGNRAMCGDTLTMWPSVDRQKLERAVVYADPPYSKDHYSRYYHVLETLARYD